ncbi:hypothetical protein ECG_08218 [Echinococcus granulosus]|nr:hypothetical protein ECG_08218 [Echinococcus granulosus]
MPLKELRCLEVEYIMWQLMLWLLHLTCGSNCFHSRNEVIIHGGLRSANMLLFDRCTTLKISDFGSWKIFDLSKEELQSVTQGCPLRVTGGTAEGGECATDMAFKVPCLEVVAP